MKQPWHQDLWSFGTRGVGNSHIGISRPGDGDPAPSEDRKSDSPESTVVTMGLNPAKKGGVDSDACASNGGALTGASPAYSPSPHWDGGVKREVPMLTEPQPRETWVSNGIPYEVVSVSAAIATAIATLRDKDGATFCVFTHNMTHDRGWSMAQRANPDADIGWAGNT